MSRPINNDEQVHIRLPSELAAKARQKARRERRPLSEIVRELLRAWLADKPAASA